MFSLNLCVLQDHKCFLVLHTYHVLLETVLLILFLNIKHTSQAVISASQNLPSQHWTDANAANKIVLLFDCFCNSCLQMSRFPNRKCLKKEKHRHKLFNLSQEQKLDASSPGQNGSFTDPQQTPVPLILPQPEQVAWVTIGSLLGYRTDISLHGCCH